MSERLPPGQILTRKWPVLHYSHVPRIEPDTWRFEISGLVERPLTLRWDELGRFPRLETTCDIHCVTRWSRFDNSFSGVPVPALIAEARPLPRAHPPRGPASVFLEEREMGDGIRVPGGGPAGPLGGQRLSHAGRSVGRAAIRKTRPGAHEARTYSLRGEDSEPVIIFTGMGDALDREKLQVLAEGKVADILRAAASWAKDVPPPLTPAIRAVCVRLAEMVADQRHYLAPLPEPQEAERAAVLNFTAEQLRAAPVTRGIEALLEELADLELRATGAWSTVEGSQAQWIATAIRFLEGKAAALSAAERPDSYWADDVVAGIIASVRALIGVDELHARTEARYSGAHRRAPQDAEERE